MLAVGNTSPIRKTTDAAARLYRSDLWRNSGNLWIVALPVTAAFGSLIPVAGPFFGFRVVALLFLVATLPRYRTISMAHPSTRTFLVLTLIWLPVGYSSILWATDRSASLRELLSVTIGLAVAIALLANSTDQKSIVRTLVTGWTVTFTVTAILGVYERLSGHHLSNYLAGVTLPQGFSYPIASTFGNPDAYAAFLVTAFPFLLLGLTRAQNLYSRIFFAACQPFLLLLLLLTGSRVCISAYFLQVIVAAVILARTRYRLVLVGSGAALVALILTGIAAEPLVRIFPFLPSKLFATGGLGSIVQELASSDGSGGQRLNLIRDGLWMTEQTHGIGVGAGNFEANVLAAPFPTRGLVNPHSLWVEILSQYGTIVFLLFVFWIAFCLIAGIRLIGRSRATVTPSTRALGLALILSVLGNVVAVNAASSYLESSTNWIFIGCLGVLAAKAETILSLNRSNSDHVQDTQENGGGN